QMATIAFIGLGNMGLPMAINLVKAGHAVAGFDVAAAAVEKLVTSGGRAAERANSSDAEIVITMLPSGKEVRDIYLGADGAIACAAPGTLLIDCSTIDVETARSVASTAQASGLAMLDAPVSGGVGGAQAGTLTFMVGGTEAAFVRAKPVLDAMGR